MVSKMVENLNVRKITLSIKYPRDLMYPQEQDGRAHLNY